MKYLLGDVNGFVGEINDEYAGQLLSVTTTVFGPSHPSYPEAIAAITSIINRSGNRGYDRAMDYFLDRAICWRNRYLARRYMVCGNAKVLIRYIIEEH